MSCGPGVRKKQRGWAITSPETYPTTKRSSQQGEETLTTYSTSKKSLVFGPADYDPLDQCFSLVE